MDWIKLSPLVAALSAITVAVLAAVFNFANAELQKIRKRKDLYRLIKAEITNLRNHCDIAGMEMLTAETNNITDVRVAKYKVGAFFMFDTKESYLLNENICQDAMILSQLARNTDIHIDELVAEIRIKPLEEGRFRQRVELISSRMSHTSKLSNVVLGHLKEYMNNPKSYKFPTIDH